MKWALATRRGNSEPLCFSARAQYGLVRQTEGTLPGNVEVT